MSSIQRIERKSGTRYKAIIKRGSRVLKTKTFTKLALARAWIRQIEADQETMDAFGLRGAAMPFGELAQEYLAQWAGNETYYEGKVQFWVEQLGRQYLTDISTQDIRQCLSNYAEGYALRWNGSRANTKPRLIATRRQRKPATVNRMKACISAIFKYAVQEGYVRSNPAKCIPNRPENNQRVRYLSDEERDRLLNAARASRWEKLHLLVLMAICTGARKSELLRLQWEHIDFQRRQALLHRTKNGESRILTLPSPVIVELMKFRGTGLIFPSHLKPWQPMEIKKHWTHALRDAQLLYSTDDPRYFRFHDLRHTAASYLVMNGATLYEAGEVLGHRSVETTKRYAHLSVDHKQRLTDRVFGSILGDADGSVDRSGGKTG